MGEKMNATDQLRENMRYWATGVAIVCVASGQSRHGMTISSFTSLSLLPPRILISIDKTTRSHQLIEQKQSFCVTLLNSTQENIAQAFAGKISESQDRFEATEWMDSDQGNPIISGGLAYFDCVVRETVDSGSHSIFIGELLSAGKPNGQIEGAQPLLYFDRDYRFISN